MMVVSSTENSGINATMNAHEMSAFMAKSLRLRAEVKERVGLNLSEVDDGSAVHRRSVVICGGHHTLAFSVSLRAMKFTTKVIRNRTRPVPIITSMSRDIFLQTPRLQEEAALALGATKWEMVKLAVLPFGSPASCPPPCSASVVRSARRWPCS